MTVLDIPYVSQLEKGATAFHNDCGAACGVMLVRVYTGDTNLTVDTYYRETGQQKDKYLSASQIRNVLHRRGIPSTWRTGVTEEEARSLIENKQPFIALIHYRIIREMGISTQVAFNGYHFVLLVGFDGPNIIIHDPLWTDGGGKYLPIPREIFLRAWAEFPIYHGVPDNPPRGALIPDYPTDADNIEIPKMIGKGERMRIVYPKGMNIRSGPGTKYAIVGSQSHGDIVTVYEKEVVDDQIWGQIGWKRWLAIEFNKNIYLVPEFPGGTLSPKKYKEHVVRNRNGVDVRTKPDFRYPIVDTLLDGQYIKIFDMTVSNHVCWGSIGIDQWVPIKQIWEEHEPL